MGGGIAGMPAAQFGDCSAGQIDELNGFAARFLGTLRSAIDGRPGFGGFITLCQEHCAAQNGADGIGASC